MFLSSHGIPSGWSVHIHPQGVRYYVHERMFHASANTLSTTCVSLLRVFTDADIVDPAEWRVLKQFLENIINYMHSKEITLRPKSTLLWALRGTRTALQLANITLQIIYIILSFGWMTLMPA